MRLPTRIRRLAASAAALLCAAGAAVSQARKPTPPTYEVLRASSPIKVDGRLDEAAWGAAKPVGPFVRNRDGAAAPVETEAKVLYDERFLYFSFRVGDENVWATMRRRDQHLWHEEVVEVFLQADPRVPNYIELEVNPLGTLLDIYLLDRRKNLPYESWNSAGVRWAVRVEGKVDGRPGDRGWTCEIALPLEDVATAPHLPPRPGDRWRTNLYRVESRPEPLWLAWSPTLEGDFHVPPMFGEIIFSGRAVP
ncbi:MAG: carbohydrate-binding family 9-like protein [Pyrinomonadaceae bacterium]